MIDFSVLGLFVLSIVVFLSTPGPVTLLVANIGARHGMQPALLTVAGTNCASLCLIAISFFVIDGLMAVSEELLSWLSVAGGFYLIYLASDMIKSEVSVEQSDRTKIDNYFMNGFVLGISNPKDVLFFIAFFPTFFTVADSEYVAISVLTVVWIIVDCSVLSLCAYLFTRVMNERRARIFSILSGGILLLIGIYAVLRVLI